MKERLLPRQGWSRSASLEEPPQVNRSLVMGLCGSVLLVVAGACLGGRPLTFVSVEGILLVLGGTLCSTLVQFSLGDLQSALRDARGALFQRQENPASRVRALVQLSRRVKESGLLVLDEEASRTTDSFFRLGLQLAVDGQQQEEISSILQTEMRTANEQSWRSVQVFETMGNFAPAMGLIGTLIGLIQMLGSLQDPSTIGPAMSLALVATLYGSVSANLFFFPIAGKLRGIAQEREQSKLITIEGLLSVARLESPIMLEQRLQGFIAVASNH